MGWLITFFFLAIGGSVLFGLLDVFLELGFNLFFSVGLPAFIIYSGVKAIKKIIDQNKVKINKSTRKNNSKARQFCRMWRSASKGTSCRAPLDQTCG